MTIWKKHLLMCRIVKNAPIQGRFTDAFEKERGMKSPWQDNSIMITALQRDDKASTPVG
jgi:hypothetical protein